ncbi:MAG: NADH-quinone oxidoreductase subunit J [Candidatus Neomarinimicrobiota bacterium]|nr:MAG: NADH-quinone oxidoreductase subunit J [Candidatus Neomarinimicrobiota bacterium]
MIVAITLGSAFMVVQGKQLLYSAIALLFTFFGVAGLYIFMWADFMAAVQIVIYIGGILVLLIFGIMLTNKITSVNISHTSLQRGAGVLVALSVLSFFGGHDWSNTVVGKNGSRTSPNCRWYRHLLMMKYLLPFEVASLLLLGALIGAAMLSRNVD